MPFTSIEVRRERPEEQVQAIIEAVHAAQREAFRQPALDRHIRYVAHQPGHFHVPAGNTENYTLVEITLFPGRDGETKRALYRLLVEKLGALGIAPADIFIVLLEVPPQDWCLRGDSC
jgi:phenylpyruvate tautomerase PptA (4-oxalocrotonate tautomerase family)